MLVKELLEQSLLDGSLVERNSLEPESRISSDEEREFVRSQVAFYASTPSYRAVLALHGWEELGEALSGLARRKDWDAMPGLIDDTILAHFAVTAAEMDLARALQKRYAGLTDRIGLYVPFEAGENPSRWEQLAAGFTGT